MAGGWLAHERLDGTGGQRGGLVVDVVAAERPDRECPVVPQRWRERNHQLRHHRRYRRRQPRRLQATRESKPAHRLVHSAYSAPRLACVDLGSRGGACLAVGGVVAANVGQGVGRCPGDLLGLGRDQRDHRP